MYTEESKIYNQSRALGQCSEGSCCSQFKDNRQQLPAFASIQCFNDEDELSQFKASQTVQCFSEIGGGNIQEKSSPVQRNVQQNKTGLPDNLKSGIESLSGFSMDNVRVHYNSSKPATVQALAYTQGTDIHVAPGQERHLPHEAWHVAQQMAGRVSPTTTINGMAVNDNVELEHEADVMGEKALQMKKKEHHLNNSKICGGAIQMLRVVCIETELDTENESQHIASDGEKMFAVYFRQHFQEIIGFCNQNINDLPDHVPDEDKAYLSRLRDIINPLINNEAKMLYSKEFLKIAEKNGINPAFERFIISCIPHTQKFSFLPNGFSNKLSWLCSMFGYKYQEDDQERNIWDSKIGDDEDLILVSHGIPVIPMFGKEYPKSLALKVSRLLNDGYHGEIYVDGCYTAVGPYPFIDLFASELKKIKPGIGHAKIKGNLGAAETQNTGQEVIDKTWINSSYRNGKEWKTQPLGQYAQLNGDGTKTITI
ncbi:MAG: DUF4157 domain-containing protein [Paludibacteraceae bacterium]|nr:DUF4157 domain-containing protein [Paludibacteraceae bacterium]